MKEDNTNDKDEVDLRELYAELKKNLRYGNYSIYFECYSLQFYYFETNIST